MTGDFLIFVPRHIIIKTHFFRQVFKLFFNAQKFLYDFIVILHKNIFSFNNFKNLVTLLFSQYLIKFLSKKYFFQTISIA